MSRYDFPAAAVECFISVENRLDAEPAFGAAFDRITEDFLRKKSISLGAALGRIDALAE